MGDTVFISNEGRRSNNSHSLLFQSKVIKTRFTHKEYGKRISRPTLFINLRYTEIDSLVTGVSVSFSFVVTKATTVHVIP